MTAFRVLVADKVKAQLYELPSRRSSLKALQSFVNPAGTGMPDPSAWPPASPRF